LQREGYRSSITPRANRHRIHPWRRIPLLGRSFCLLRRPRLLWRVWRSSRRSGSGRSLGAHLCLLALPVVHAAAARRTGTAASTIIIAKQSSDRPSGECNRCPLDPKNVIVTLSNTQHVTVILKCSSKPLDHSQCKRRLRGPSKGTVILLTPRPQIAHVAMHLIHAHRPSDVLYRPVLGTNLGAPTEC